MRPIAHLTEALLAAGIPTIGTALIDPDASRPVVRVDLPEQATEAQRAQADAIAASFDWSDEAGQEWEDFKRPKRTALRQRKDAIMAACDAFMGLSDAQKSTPVALKDQAKVVAEAVKLLVQRAAEID